MTTNSCFIFPALRTTNVTLPAVMLFVDAAMLHSFTTIATAVGAAGVESATGPDVEFGVLAAGAPPASASSAPSAPTRTVTLTGIASPSGPAQGRPRGGGHWPPRRAPSSILPPADL